MSQYTDIHWSAFYEKGNVLEEPSSFARFCLPRIQEVEISSHGQLFEWGCGNGRDALFFIRKNIAVWGCDACSVAIEKVRQKAVSIKYPSSRFFQADFTQFKKDQLNFAISTIYARFTLHAIDHEGASRALAWGSHVLPKGGLFCIEARSVLDPMYKQGNGTPVGRDAFIYEEGHYRRFIRKEELVAELSSLAFELETVIESDNLAMYGNDNPVVIRVIARKK